MRNVTHLTPWLPKAQWDFPNLRGILKISAFFAKPGGRSRRFFRKENRAPVSRDTVVRLLVYFSSLYTAEPWGGSTAATRPSRTLASWLAHRSRAAWGPESPSSSQQADTSRC